MQNVKLDRDSLKRKVLENRDAHKRAYEEAMEGYRQQLVEELKDRLERAATGKEVEHFINLPKPESHEAEYERVIKMLEMSVDKEITLNQVDFGRYVMDEWEWKQAFAATASNYSNRR